MIIEKKRVKNAAKFIENSIKRFGDKFDYAKVEYMTEETPVVLTCREHRIDFTVQPRSHKLSHTGGCPGCNKVGPPKTPESEFLRRVREVHGDKYDYSHLGYDGMLSYVTIGCPKHGDFTQKACEHLRSGCNECRPLNNRLTQEEFVRRATAIHQGRYSYNKAEYETYDSVITITCPVHGDYEQSAHSHLTGRGCSKCRAKMYGWEGMQLYIFKEHGAGLTKVGITKKSLSDRVAQLNIQSKMNFEPLHSYYYGDGGDAKCIEMDMLKWMSDNFDGVEGRYGGYSEVFKTTDTEAVLQKLHELTQSYFKENYDFAKT